MKSESHELDVPPLDVFPRFVGPIVVGTPAERAREALEAFPARTASLERRMAEVPATIESGARNWVVASIDLLDRTFPDVAEYLEATASAVGVDYLAMQAAYFSGIGLTADGDMVPGVSDPEGCSTAAGVHAEVGAWVVKNRDTPPSMLDRQSVVEHRDPAWNGKAVVGVSSVGGCMAASSGINSQGLVSVTTSIRGRSGPPGIARTHVQDALLSRCETVDEALELIMPIQHIGGTLTLADATGAIAAVDLSPGGAIVDRKDGVGGVARTNHYVRSDPAFAVISDTARLANSVSRLESMKCVLDEVDDHPTWPALREWLRSRMAIHDGPGAQCRHGGSSITASTSIYSCKPPAMITSDGPGCNSPWVSWQA